MGTKVFASSVKIHSNFCLVGISLADSGDEDISLVDFLYEGIRNRISGLVTFITRGSVQKHKC